MRCRHSYAPRYRSLCLLGVLGVSFSIVDAQTFKGKLTAKNTGCCSVPPHGYAQRTVCVRENVSLRVKTIIREAKSRPNGDVQGKFCETGEVDYRRTQAIYSAGINPTCAHRDLIVHTMAQLSEVAPDAC